MQLATTTGDFSPYSSSVEDTLRYIRASGFRNVDYSFSEATVPPGLLEDGWRQCALSIRRYAEELGMAFVQSHAPMGSPLIKDERYARFLFLTKRSIQVAAALGAKNIVVHSGYEKGISKEACFERNRQFYRELLPLAEEYGICILTENFNKMCVPDIYWVDSAQDQKELIEYVDHPLLQGCWDTGHGNMQAMSQRKAVNLLGKHLRALHVQDNLGDEDHHFAPFFGTLDIDSLMQGLLDIHYDGYFTFECTNMALPSSRRRGDSSNGPLRQLPVELKIKTESLLWDIGNHILSAYALNDRT